MGINEGKIETYSILIGFAHNDIISAKTFTGTSEIMIVLNCIQYT